MASACTLALRSNTKLPSGEEVAVAAVFETVMEGGRGKRRPRRRAKIKRRESDTQPQSAQLCLRFSSERAKVERAVCVQREFRAVYGMDHGWVSFEV